jgi:hypothetical protein
MPHHPTRARSLHEPQVYSRDPAHLDREVTWPISGKAHPGPGGVVLVDYLTDDGRSGLHVYTDPDELVMVNDTAGAAA